MQSIATEGGSVAARPSSLHKRILGKIAKKTIDPVAVLDARVVGRLLDLLSTDNSFRRLFKKDPNTALATLGYNNPKMCGPVEAIASKQEISATADQLKAHLISTGLFRDPHCFEAGKVAARLRAK